MRQRSEAEILHRMAAYCSVAERCIQDVEKKIASDELTEDARKQIIDHLLTEKFLDESRYTYSFVNDKLRFNKWGKIKISYELQKKNIPAAIRSAAINKINPEEYRLILHSLLKEKKRSTKGKDDYDIFNKLLRFAAGRGFEANEVIPILKELFNGEEYTDGLD